MSDDPFLWLEEIDGAPALDWVRAQNERSLRLLECDPRFDELYQAALAVVTATDRIPYPRLLGDGVSNFWQDERHVRGLWRRASLDSFAQPEPEWQILLDIDALAACEGRNWVYHGANTLPPDDRRGLVGLSDGGKDAAEWREFDIASRAFVAGGFSLPEGKQSVAWLDGETLLVARDWGPGTMTASGYAFVLKRLRRGAALDAAEEVFRGSPEDVAVRPCVLRDPDGAVRGVLAIRALNFFEHEVYLLTESGPRLLPAPRKSSIRGFVSGQLVLSLEEDWEAAPGLRFPTGALVALDLAQDWRPTLVLAPGPREAIEGVAATRSHLLVTLYRNVRGAALALRFIEGAWVSTPLPLPDNASIQVVSSEDQGERAFLDVAGFLEPNTLFLADLEAGAAGMVKSAPARFNPDIAVVEQFDARSGDGTPVPYFVVRPKTMPGDGATPTLLYGYGGFQVSMTPSYIPVVGRLWLERGGAYVVANIRGGGEFGPEWHQAALKQNRRRAFEDFIAVADDLIARRLTSPRRLGIMGGSNGGLLMGAMLTQRPDLFRAVVIQVPLLDMLRYHRLLAGASWIAEYGDPDDPQDAQFLQAISPYHNLRPGAEYPEPLFVTSTKDDRVHPGHARKMAARMEGIGLSFLYYENIDGGHSAAANLGERARRQALEFTYLTRKLMDDG